MFKKLKQWINKHRFHKWVYYRKVHKKQAKLYYCRKCKICGMTQLMFYLTNTKYKLWTYHDIPIPGLWTFDWEKKWFDDSVVEAGIRWGANKCK